MNILIIGTEPNILSSIRKDFDEHGYHTTMAFSLAEAKRLISEIAYSLFVVDLKSGFESLRICCEPKKQDAPVLLINSLNLTQDEIFDLNGVDDCLDTPFELKDLLTRSESLMQKQAKA